MHYAHDAKSIIIPKTGETDCSAALGRRSRAVPAASRGVRGIRPDEGQELQHAIDERADGGGDRIGPGLGPRSEATLVFYTDRASFDTANPGLLVERFENANSAGNPALPGRSTARRITASSRPARSSPGSPSARPEATSPTASTWPDRS
jgi:hypothetical protein